MIRWMFTALVWVSVSSCASMAQTHDARAKCTMMAAAPDGEYALTDVANCLGDVRSDVRDGFAYSRLTQHLRSGELPPEDIFTLGAHLVEMLHDPDPHGVRRPFVALVLSEVVRTDRIAPWMDDETRAVAVDEGVSYVTGITDYRGYIDGEGWRHGVAHGADWLMQLALNPALTEDQASAILGAVAAQVSPDGHAYIHGEPGRLARPVVYLARSGKVSDVSWAWFFAFVADATPLEGWSDAFNSEAGLIQRHNTKAFLTALMAETAGIEDGERAGFKAALETAYRDVP